MKQKRVVKKKRKTTPAKSKKLLLPCDPAQKPIPYQGRAAVGSVILNEGKPAVVALVPIGSNLRYTEGYIFVPDDRMEPARKKGDRMGICRKPHMQPLYWGYEYFIIDRTLNGVLCRIHPLMKKTDSITLKFDNKQYRPRMPQFSRLKGLFLVEPLQGWPKE